MLFGLFGTTPALADSPCLFDPATHTASYAFNATADPNLPTVQRAGFAGTELFVGTEGGGSGDLCSDGTTSATVFNTDTIRLTGNPPGPGGSPRVQFFFLNGPLAPGFTDEGDGSSEIEVQIPAASGSLVIGLGGETSGASDASDYIVAGSQGINLNAGELGLGDLDIDVGPATLAGLTAYGGLGDDTISTAGGHGTGNTGITQAMLFGGPGNDILAGATALSGTLDGGPGNDDLTGNSARGFAAVNANYGAAPGPGGVVVMLGVTGSATGDGTDTLNNIFSVTGSPFADTITGDNGVNIISGETRDSGGGADTINGLGGDDTLSGSGGDDIVNGGDGNDTLYGDRGNDTLLGGNGNDSLSGDSSVAAGDDKLYGEAGNDLLAPERGSDLLDGGPGTADQVLFGSYGVAGITADLLLATPQDIGGGLGTKTFAAVESLTGTPFADTLRGDDGPNVLFGGSGGAADTLEGRGGADTLSFNLPASGGRADGGDGNDTITGSDGPDVLNGGAGSDVINGRKGNDVLSGPADGVNDTLNCEEGNDAVSSYDLAFDSVRNCEILTGGVGSTTAPPKLPDSAPVTPAEPEEPPAPDLTPDAVFGFPKLPTAKSGCLKGSSVTITVRRASGVTWDRVTAVARASGKRTTRTIVGPPETAELHMGVSLRGLPRGLFTLTLTARTSTGVSVVAKRGSRTCAVKKVAAKKKTASRR